LHGCLVQSLFSFVFLCSTLILLKNIREMSVGNGVFSDLIMTAISCVFSKYYIENMNIDKSLEQSNSKTMLSFIYLF